MRSSPPLSYHHTEAGRPSVCAPVCVCSLCTVYHPKGTRCNTAAWSCLKTIRALFYIFSLVVFRHHNVFSNVQTQRNTWFFSRCYTFIGSSVTITSERESGRRLANVTKRNMNKNCFICEHFSLSHRWNKENTRSVFSQIFLHRLTEKSYSCCGFLLLIIPVWNPFILPPLAIPPSQFGCSS